MAIGRLWCNMPLIEKNFFGPQKYVAEIITHPPYTTRVNMTRYGYESKRVIYDVVIPERPIQGFTRWYKTNGESSPSPTETHTHIERHFGLGHLPDMEG